LTISARKFLAVYDYGMGGLWWYFYADTAAQITAEFPDLKVFETLPPWWTEEMEKLTAVQRLGDEITDKALIRLKAQSPP
jgi:hypothetical protein